MSHNTVKAASFPAAFTPLLVITEGNLLPTQIIGVAIGRHQTLHPKACRSQFCKPVRFPPNLAAQAAAAPPQQAQRRRSTAHSFVSLCRCPCYLPTRHQPNPIATHQFVPPENLPTQQPCQRRSFLSKPAEHRSRQRRSPCTSSSVTSVPPATLPLLFANPTPPASNPAQCIGVENGCSTKPQSTAAASPASPLVLLSCLQPRQQQPTRSRRSVAVPLHMVPFHFSAAPAFLPCFRQRSRFPRPSLSHLFEKCLHSPTHPFQRCEKQPQSPQPKRRMQAATSRFTGKHQPASGAPQQE
jgi:hypothetical protein